MTDFWESTLWNSIVLLVLGLIAVFTQEFVTYIMLGFLIIILSNIYNVLKEISNKLNTKEKAE